MEKAALTYTMPVKKGVTTRLWALCEQVAGITGTKPGRWLKAGEWALERALIDYAEATKRDVTGYQPIKNKGAYMTWLVGKYMA